MNTYNSSDGLRIASGGRDKTFRLWSAQTHQEIGDPFQGHTRQVYWAYQSPNGMFLVSADTSPEIIIRDRRIRAILWRSTEDDADANNTISNIDAEKNHSKSGRLAPHLWPNCFPEYTAELVLQTIIRVVFEHNGQEDLTRQFFPLTHRTSNSKS